MLCKHCARPMCNKTEVIVMWHEDKYHSECFINMIRRQREIEDEMQSALSGMQKGFRHRKEGRD